MGRKRHGIRIVVCTVIVGIFAFVDVSQSLSQTVTGSIAGTVRDPQGAVIPNATIAARNVETGIERTAISDNSGGFIIASVPAGDYSVTISAPGFQPNVLNGINLTVGALVRLDLTLRVGSLAEAVEVTAQAPQVDTTTSTMSGLVSDNVIRQLPLNQRDWLQLAVMQAGVNIIGNTSGSGAAATGIGMKMSISGGRPNANVYRIDGMVVNDQTNDSPGSALGGNMGVDSVREFTVLTNTFSAEYGRSSGGVVNAITKSGTNDIHGTAFEFLRNSVFDARNPFDVSLPPFRRNQFGASLGGPAKKDKLFFFGNYEGLRQFFSVSLNSTTLSPNARNGIICANPPACTTSNRITVDPRIQAYLPLFPVPNGTITGDTGQFVTAAGQIGHEDYATGKLDYQLSAKTTLTGGYTFDRANISTPDSFLQKLSSTYTRNQRVALSLQHVFSPTLLNTVRAGFSRQITLAGLYSNPTTPLLSDPSLGFVPGKSVGTLNIPGLTSFGGMDSSGGDHFWYTAPQFNDDLNWVRGRHNIRIGFSVESIQDNLNSPSNPAGQWQFGSVANFLQSIPQQFMADFPGTNAYRGLRDKLFGTYIQDDFRVRPNLTVNLGVRYAPATVISVVNRKAARLLNLTDPQVTPLGDRPLYQNPTLEDFDPRIGFAWDPSGNGKTAIRSGFGMYSIPPMPNIFNLLIDRTAPFIELGNVQNPPASSFPNGGFSLLGVNSLQAFYEQPDPRRSYKMQWNLNIQREVITGLAVTAGYVGARGVHLSNISADIDMIPPSYVTKAPDGHWLFPLTKPVPRINPNFSQIRNLFWDGYSTYHALQVNVTERLRKNLISQVTYALSKSIDNGSVEYSNAELQGSMDSPYRFFPQIQRGPSDFDVPQHVSVNLVWDAPSLHSGFAASRFVLSGWEVSGIFQGQSGTPFGIRLPNDQAGTGSLVAGTVNDGQRPDFKPGPGCSNPVNSHDRDHYIKLECFAFPAQGTLGNLGRNAVRGPNLRNLDMSLLKNHLTHGEKLKVQFRAEAFNLLNRPNYAASLVTLFTSQGAPVPTSAALRTTRTKSRQIQFGLRLEF